MGQQFCGVVNMMFFSPFMRLGSDRYCGGCFQHTGTVQSSVSWNYTSPARDNMVRIHSLIWLAHLADFL